MAPCPPQAPSQPFMGLGVGVRGRGEGPAALSPLPQYFLKK
jgi:hypothetical protein